VHDPDGDVVRYLASSCRGHGIWGGASYYTQVWTVDLDGEYPRPHST
jgi:hypothetical protein